MNNFEIRMEQLKGFSLGNLKLVEHMQEPINYCETSIKPLNKALGGLASGQYYMVCAPTNAGKSTLLQSLMIDCMKQGHKCLYITTEDETNDVATNILLALSNIPLSKYFTNQLNESNLLYAATVQDKYKDMCYFYHRESLMEDVTSIVVDYLTLGVEYVFYDYVGSIPDPDHDNTYAVLIKESDALQKIALRHQVCIMSAVQCNGNIYDTKDGKHDYTFNDIAGAKGLANKAKVVLFLYDERGEDNQMHKMMKIAKAKRWINPDAERIFELYMNPNNVCVKSQPKGKYVTVADCKAANIDN